MAGGGSVHVWGGIHHGGELMLISFGYFDKCDTKCDHLVLTSFVAAQMMPYQCHQ
jgi:hypothetical protein